MADRMVELARKLRAFGRLSWAERRAAGEVLLLALAVEAGLRVCSLARLARMLGVTLIEDPARKGSRALALNVEELRRLRVATLVFRNWPGGGTCLRRSLVVGHVLRRRGPLVRIGVARGEAGRIHAHAWVEIDGRPLGGDGEGFVPLAARPMGATSELGRGEDTAGLGERP
ncbi:MAG: lasso peptide biosynthesis B2 protein [Candidatus Binatia bacterium]